MEPYLHSATISLWPIAKLSTLPYTIKQCVSAHLPGPLVLRNESFAQETASLHKCLILINIGLFIHLISFFLLFILSFFLSLTAFSLLTAGAVLLLHLIALNDTHLAELLRTRDRPLASTHSQKTSMPPAEFEHTISAGQQQQTYALDRAATGSGLYIYLWLI